MKVLMMDSTSSLLDLSMRAMAAGHDVKHWMPTHRKPNPVGDGLVVKVLEWEKWMAWADLIILSDNCSYVTALEPFFTQGYPIFGCNRQGAELELDRGVGQEVFKKHGMKVLPYEIFTNYDKAIAYVKKENRPLVSKPWGGSSHKELSFVAKRADDLIYKLQHWKEEGTIKGQFMLQEKVDGIEMAVGGWFGKKGWGRYVCENFEEKCLLNEGLGGNTGEQGTILHYTKSSKLFKKVLEPLEDHLLSLGYIGYADVNCIIDEKGIPWPLEFTMRFGDPTQVIQQALHEGDPVEWMLDLIEGKDTLKVKDDIAVGVLVTHGDYPHSKMTGKMVEGVPIRGLDEVKSENIHFCNVMLDVAPEDGEDVAMPVTAGDYVLVTTGIGPTVRAAQRGAYKAAWAIDFPSNRGFRTDIGDRLKDTLPLLHKMGYAKEVEF